MGFERFGFGAPAEDAQEDVAPSSYESQAPHQSAERLMAVERGAIAHEDYETSEGTVRVSSRVFSPEGGAESGTSTIFLTGYSAEMQNESVIGLSEAFARRGGKDVHMMNTRMETAGLDDSLRLQAEGIVSYIRAHGLHDVTVIGYSNGGAKAEQLVALLRAEDGVVVNRLVLINAGGLVDQLGSEIEAGFKGMARVPRSIKEARGIGEVVMSGMRELARSGSYKAFTARTQHDATRMGIFDERVLGEIDVPVTVVHADNDAVMDLKKFPHAISVEPGRIPRPLGTHPGLEQTPGTTYHRTNAMMERDLHQIAFPNAPTVDFVRLGGDDARHDAPEMRPDDVAAEVFSLHRRANDHLAS